MKNNEKKALISFLSIYIGSASILIGALLYFYYINELKSVDEHCSMQMSNAVYEIKTDILNSYMKKQEYIPKPMKNKDLRYALYSHKKELIYSTLLDHDIKFDNQVYETPKHTYLISKINEKMIPIKYIVVETCLAVEDKRRLQFLMIGILIVSTIFVGFIAYLLSKILLRPVREKIEQIDKFIKDSAHELNTPIAVLRTSVSMLKNKKNEEKMLRYISSSTKQISQIYNDLHYMAFNEIDEVMDESFNFKELVEDSIDFYTEIAQNKKIEIFSKLEETKIVMDRNKALKLVNNLLSNAIKYSNKNSKIEVTLEDCCLVVKDYGIGISKQNQKYIFKRYKRGENNEGGFGIGLDIVKSICLDYDLHIFVDSIEKEGTTFTLDFSNIKD